MRAGPIPTEERAVSSTFRSDRSREIVKVTGRATPMNHFCGQSPVVSPLLGRATQGAL